jgi:hypothetical protein
MNYVCVQLGDGSNTDRNTPPSSNVLTGVAATIPEPKCIVISYGYCVCFTNAVQDDDGHTHC